MAPLDPNRPAALPIVTREGPAVVVAISSTVAAPADVVWARVSTWEGVNAELMPHVRMHEPRSIKGRTIADYQPGEHAVSWLLAGGVIPFDRHVLGLESITPGVGFVEESTSALQKRWRHERTLEPALDGTATTVSDRVTVVPRLPFARPLVQRLVPRIFRLRHAKLRRHFG